jgi:ribonuclease HI
MNEYYAWFEGACEPVNPGGTARFGVVIKGEDGTVLLRDHRVVGKGSAMSNNVAEYAGVRRVLGYLASRPPGRATIHGDSNLVINQLNDRWRTRKGVYLAIATEAKELLVHLRKMGWEIDFRWIPREKDKECCDVVSRSNPALTAQTANGFGGRKQGVALKLRLSTT